MTCVREDAYTLILKSSTRGLGEAELLEQRGDHSPEVAAEDGWSMVGASSPIPNS